jgi:orotidine-5'-phosphate decarboxylase
MQKSELVQQIRMKKSYLCVGLDTDTSKLPPVFKEMEDPVYEYNKIVIEQTSDVAVAYKLNLAFYESIGYKGWISLEKTLKLIPDNIFKIADAKRGDIGNTSKQYATTFFKTFNFDAITVSPYMGEDSIGPFMEFDGKWVIILALTSNKGSNDFQMLESGGKKIYEHILEKSSKWGSDKNTMYVVGATHPGHFSHIRTLIPDHFILIPGVGAQGGDLEAISNHAINKDIGILVNVSRNILFPDNDLPFPENIRQEALNYQQQMSVFVK